MEKRRRREKEKMRKDIFEVFGIKIGFWRFSKFSGFDFLKNRMNCVGAMFLFVYLSFEIFTGKCLIWQSHEDLIGEEDDDAECVN